VAGEERSGRAKRTRLHAVSTSLFATMTLAHVPCHRSNKMPDGKKKIFISWSKFQSKRVAHVLKDYLPEILEDVEIFMSDKDIDPGQRSMKVLENELDGTTYGIAVVTEANQSEPWLNFEAGALSKAVVNDNQGVPYVVPLLVDIQTTTQLTGPISQFQAVQLNHDGLAEIITSICKLVNINENIALKRFDRAWSEINEALSTARKRPTPRDDKKPRTDSQKIDEALEILRTMQRQQAVDSDPVPVRRSAPKYDDLARAEIDALCDHYNLMKAWSGVSDTGDVRLVFRRTQRTRIPTDRLEDFEQRVRSVAGPRTVIQYVKDARDGDLIDELNEEDPIPLVGEPKDEPKGD
jgi:TIR domain